MPRAHRHSLPGHVWHITHRCHETQFLLRYACDRKTWLYWLYEARKRYGLCVLDYAVTRNHVHLLAQDRGADEIPSSMRLVAGCTGQRFNSRYGRKGAFWEDRYHATAIQTDGHLARCLVYIDLNMVRAGVVRHPSGWRDCGYNEIQSPRDRYRIIDHARLAGLLGLEDAGQLRELHHAWVENALAQGAAEREPQWSSGVAIGDPAFLEAVRRELWPRQPGSRIRACGTGYQLKEPPAPYSTSVAGTEGL
jgi:putative transposase